MSSKEVGFKDGICKQFNPAKQVRVGIQNSHRWILIKESLGFVSDSQFASFLLNLAEQQNTPENNTTPDTGENVDKIDSQQQKMEETKTRERAQPPPDGTGHVYEGGDSEYEEEDSLEDDDEDDDWKPSGCRQPRVMKRPSRGRKKYENRRQTRSQSKAALTDREIDEKGSYGDNK
uniref:Uncharacterized protein n=1 Tax=Strigamia maritima TaxID=126957 RepID=T1JN78_STRMM